MTINHEMMVRNEQLSESHEYTEAVVDIINEAVIILTRDFRIISANRSFYQKFKLREQEVEGQLLFDMAKGEWDMPQIRELLEQRVSYDTSPVQLEVQREFESHQLLPSQRPATSSDHSLGISIDASIVFAKGKRRSRVDRLARRAGLVRPHIQRDPVHFRLIAAAR